MNLRIIATSLALVGSLSVVGCKTSTSPNDNPSPAGKPKVGSTFTMNVVETDPMSNTTTTSTHTERVAQTGLSFAGKSNVMKEITASENGSEDTSFIAYESNGDVSAYIAGDNSVQIPGAWSTFTFASQQSNTIQLDGTFDDVSGSYPIHVEIRNTGAGKGTFTVQGKTYTTQKVTSVKSMSSQGEVFMTQTSTVEYVPELGWIVRREAPPVMIGDMSIPGETETLTAFSIK